MRKMGIGLGVGINRSNYAQGIFNAYSARVVADGGVVESGACVDAVSSLLQSASLLLIPSAYKGGKLYAEIPTNGNGDLTWTRGGDAFRTNASGVIQRVPWNLLQQSETFSDAYWNKITSTITANTTTAPNGTLTADTLSVTTSTYSGLGRAITGVSANYNVSIYAKKNTKSWLYIIDVQGTGSRAWFDLDNGVLGTVANGYTATITNVGDGWYRCTLSNNNAQTLAYYQLGLADANNGITPTSSGSAFIWGAQLVEGTTAQTYLPTTDRLNFPRLSYMYGSCPSALLEPQRTNLGTNSQNFADASWAVLGATKVATNLTDPSNTNTACNVTWPSGGGKIFYGTRSSSPGTYTISFYVKSSNGSKFRLYDGVSTSISSDFTATSTFQRFSYTFTQSAGTGGFYGILSASDGSAADIVVAFAQFEAGSYSTTYIPTTSAATATRVADSASKTGISSLIGQSEGVVFIDFIYGGASNESTNLINANRNLVSSFYVIRLTTGAIEAGMAIGGGSVAKITGSSIAVGTRYKLAYAYKSGSSALYINGVQIGTSSDSFTVTQSINEINLNDINSFFSVQRVAFFNSVALFTNRLTNAELATLTT